MRVRVRIGRVSLSGCRSAVSGNATKWRRWSGRASTATALSAALSLFFGMLWLVPSSAALPSVPGTPWYWASPQPTGAELYGVAAVGDEYWAVGTSGAIVHSADGGESWVAQASGTTAPLDAVTFVDSQNGWAVGGGQLFVFWPERVILHTTDGGQSWAEQKLPAGTRSLHAVAFLDAQRGWAVGDGGTILQTTDGGATWKRRTVSGITDDLWCVAFADSRRGIIGGPDGACLRTRDGGASWQVSHLPSWRNEDTSLDSVIDLAFSNPSCGYALFGSKGPLESDGCRLYRTSDAGAHWARMVWPRGVPRIESLTLDQGGGLCAAGYDWDLDIFFLRLKADGRSWQRSRWSSGMVMDLAAGPSGLVAVGERILTSVDGLRWYARNSTPMSCLDLEMLDATHGFAIDYQPSALSLFYEDADDVPVGDSVISATQDGVRWAERAVLPGCQLSAVEFVDSQHGWATDRSSGRLFETTDGGASWTPRTLEADCLADVRFIDAEHGWVSAQMGTGRYEVGIEIWEGRIFSTEDGGVTWTSHALGVERGGERIFFLDQLHGWAVSTGAVLRTTDGGNTWTRQRAALGMGSEVHFSDELHGWAVGDGGGDWPDPAICRTSDGGLSWQAVERPSILGYQFCIQAIDADSARVMGTGIWRTDDGGATWLCEVPNGGPIWTRQPGIRTWSMPSAEPLLLWAGGCGLLCTVDVAGESATPASLVNSTTAWHRLPYTIKLNAADVGGSGLAGSEYRLDTETEWHQAAGEITLTAAPGDHSLDGHHRLHYRSVDGAGNVEPTQIVPVRIDTTPPRLVAPKAVTVRTGRSCTLPVRVYDIPGANVTLTTRIYDSSGRLVRKIAEPKPWWPSEAPGVWFRCRLVPGRYRFQFSGIDEAGNRQAVVASNVLTVRQ